MIQWLSLTFVSFRVFRKHNKLFEFYRTLAYRHSSFNRHLRSSSKTNLEQKINNSERNCSHTERPSTWRVSSNVYPSLIVILERRKHYWLISKFVSTFTGNLILAFDNEDRERESNNFCFTNKPRYPWRSFTHRECETIAYLHDASPLSEVSTHAYVFLRLRAQECSRYILPAIATINAMQTNSRFNILARTPCPAKYFINSSFANHNLP